MIRPIAVVFTITSCLFALLFSACPLMASEYHGSVSFGGLPVPGATVTAAQNARKQVAVTDQQGSYSFPALPDGMWTIEVEMPGFAPIHQDITVAPGGQASEFELKILPFAEIVGKLPPPPAAPQPPPAAAQAPGRRQPAKAAPPVSNGFQRAAVNASAAPAAAPPSSPSAASSAADAIPPNANNDSDLAQRAADGLLINGSVNNGAASPFAQAGAFGNNRRGPASLYQGMIGFIGDTSALDARQFSLTGQDVAKPTIENLTGLLMLAGPLRIPHLLRNGPVFFVAYQWTRNRTAQTQPALVPTLDQRNGDVGNGVVIPQSQISPQARFLLNYYPLPNFTGNAAYNYEAPLTTAQNRDALQSRLSKSLGQRTQLYGSFNFQRIANSNPNIFGFLDTGNTFGLNTDVNLQRRIGNRLFVHARFQYSYQSVRSTPYFANRENVSGEAGITGNEQSPADWGPPTLSFSNGIASLSDAINSFNRNQTAAWSNDNSWNHGRHNITFGGDFRRQ
jgi:hypothetical protein